MFLNLINRSALRVARSLRNKRGKVFANRIEKITDSFHRSINNVNFDINTNGELRVLKILAEQKPACIFDVGANIGEWSLLVSGLNKESIIHAFEIVPDT